VLIVDLRHAFGEQIIGLVLIYWHQVYGKASITSFAMYWKFIIWHVFILYRRAYSHLFVGNPPPFRVDKDVTFLIMPLNGDPNATPPVGQQPFPCKGYQVDLDGAGGEPVAQWAAGQDVTFSHVSRTKL
jgi:hypothetical protein